MQKSPDKTAQISKEAQHFIQSLPPFTERPQLPRNGTVEAWRNFQELVEERTAPTCENARQTYMPTICEMHAGQLKALLIAPQTSSQHAAPAIYIHGGGYTSYSASSSLFAAIPLAAALSRPLISINYPLAPQFTFRDTVPATTAALADLLQRFSGAGIIGESAGGGLALSVVNRLLHQNLRPCCLALISPWTDLCDRGESRRSMAGLDPILQYEPELLDCAEAYAPGAFDDPNASPVLASYDDAFPPSLIQCGSREVLLSDSERLHRKLKAAGVTSTLEVFDGMFHSFPILAADLPESKQAMRSIKALLDLYY